MNKNNIIKLFYSKIRKFNSVHKIWDNVYIIVDNKRDLKEVYDKFTKIGFYDKYNGNIQFDELEKIFNYRSKINDNSLFAIGLDKRRIADSSFEGYSDMDLINYGCVSISDENKSHILNTSIPFNDIIEVLNEIISQL